MSAGPECSHDRPDATGAAVRPADDTYESLADRAADAALSAQPRSFTPSAGPATSAGSGAGRPLTREESSYFAPRFGFDFSQVRIHADTAAGTRADALGAEAYTRGSSISFSRPPDLASTSGRRLMAHELAHVVQQSRTPSLAGSVQRQPKTAPGIKRVVIYRKTKQINVTLSDDTTMRLTMNSRTTLDAGTYKGKHVKESTTTDGVVTEKGEPLPKAEGWFFDYPSAPPFKWQELATSEYELIVYDKRRPGSREEELPSAKKGGKDGQGSGSKGTGTGTGAGAGAGDKKGAGDKAGGDKAGGDKAGGDKAGGDKAGGDKKGGGDKAGGDKLGGDPGGSGEERLPPETDAEKKAKLDRVLKELRSLPDVGGPPMSKEQLDKLAEMSASELADILKYLKETAAASEDPIDASAELDKYLAMSPSDRELLRINQHLLTDAKSGPLPDKVKIALDTSASSTQKLGEATTKVNEQLANLKKIHAKVTHDTLLDEQDADLDPIELEKLPVFREMMMLEGLLAGASTKSAKIEESAKDLTKSIAGIRDYVLEEILWLAAELGASYIIGALTGPIGTGLAAARGAMLIQRLNKLRKFLQKVEQVYSTYQRVTTIVAKVSRAYSTYKTFETNFAEGLAELEKLREQVEDPNLDEPAVELAQQKLEELENQLVDKMLLQLESNTGVGALMEYFDIPEDAVQDDEQLRQILFNIPKGLQELDALMARYRASGRDLESVKLLTYKSVLVGALLYPFVGFLARETGSKLHELMAEKDLGDRLLSVIDRASSGKKGYKAPGAAKTRTQLTGAKRKPKAKSPDPKKKDPGKPAKPPDAKKKGDADPAKDPAKPTDPTKKPAPTHEDAGKPKTPAKPGDTQDPTKKPDTDDSPQAKKKVGEPDTDPAKKKSDDPDPKAKDPKDPKDKDPKDPKDPKQTPGGPDESEWLQVVAKVKGLPGRNLPEGATKSSLRTQGNKIKKKHTKVCRSVRVERVTGKGEWRLIITRKGAPGQTQAEVMMGYRERWEEGREAVSAAVAKLDATSRTKTTIDLTIRPFEKAYTYAALEVVDHTTPDRSGFTVVGRMGNAARRDIVDVDDLTGLHTGEASDPIPIYWYKHESWYPGYAKPLKLTIDGNPVDFKMTDPPRDVTLKNGDKIPIGVDSANIIKKDSVILRKRTTERDPDPIDNLKNALKRAGYSQWVDMDIDHITDLAFRGTNKYSNLWPLNREKNRHAFNGTWYRNYGIQYLDKKDPLKLKTGTIYTLVGKYFKIEGIEPRVRGYGGRTKGAKP